MADAREFEFGVPFPGRVVAGDLWSRTGHRDNGMPFDWDLVFGRSSARVVDLGCGNGRYLIGSALSRPDRDHLGIDLVQVAIDFAAHRANKRGLRNVRFVTGDAVLWLFERLLENSVDEIHVYHPQPYYEAADVSQRMLTPEFLVRAWRVLRPEGVLVLQTDNKAYWKYLLGAVSGHFTPEIVAGPWPEAPQGRTRREIQARSKGLVIWRMIAHRRAVPIAVPVSPPDFDANRPRFKKRKGGGRRPGNRV
jgi:tRNA (guanine-N7-)-methyltransferase